MSDAPVPDSLTDKFAPALQPPLNLGGANDPIQLYSGPVSFSQDRMSFVADGRISLEWLPSPKIRIQIPDVPNGNLPSLDKEFTLQLEDGTEITHCFTTGLTNAFEWPGHRSSLSGFIGQRVIRPKDGPARYALFVVPNFDDMRGVPIAYPERKVACARLVLAANGWRITLDELDNLKEVKERLRATSGFGVTYVGRLEREDGKEFTAEEAWKILSALGWYQSFCCGRWTGPLLPHGYAADGKQVWTIWDRFRTAPYKHLLSWIDLHHTEHLSGPFPGFLKLWEDEEWEEVIRVAIHWYIEANAQAGSIEGSIVLTQTAFELLSSAVLVENHGWLSTDGYEKLAAADRIRLLFLWAGIPTAIPMELNDLAKLARANNWPDAPTAMTNIRNTITHPTRKNREKFGNHPDDARRDAWSLGLWFLELCLLRLFDYHGTYGNRLTYRYAGQVIRVPWTTKGPLTE